MVKHLSVAINKHKYKLIYQENFGGVIALTKEQFNQSNGFSNKFFGWGGEDDNFYTRVVNLGFKVFRYPANIARYSMLKHGKVNKILYSTYIYDHMFCNDHQSHGIRVS